MDYCMNLNDGRLCAANEETDRQTSYTRVPEDIAYAISAGKLDWHKVAELVHKKRNNDPSFSWTAFDELRDKQNIRRAKYEPEEVDKSEEEKKVDTVQHVEITMAELVGKKGDTKKAENANSSSDKELDLK